MDAKIFDQPVNYLDAVAAMEAHVAAIRAQHASEQIWLLEHPPLYTAGTSAKSQDLLVSDLPVFATGRGGQYTYHGPGQRIAYVMLDLAARGGDVRRFVFDLEEMIIRTLAVWGVTAVRREGRIGIWIVDPKKEQGSEKKIAAIGVRVRKGVTYHGLSLNVNPDLMHYRGIVPCGLADFGVTSLAALGHDIPMTEIDAALIEQAKAIFG